MELEQDIYLLNVSIESGHGIPVQDIYRVIALRGKSTLYTLARAILRAFNFDFDHLFEFYDNEFDKKYEFYHDHKSLKESGAVMHVKVQEVFTEIGKEMLFLYDYGDQWRFFVEFTEKISREEGERYPRVTECQGKVPNQYEPPFPPEEPEDDPYQRRLDELFQKKEPINDCYHQKNLDEFT